MESKIRIKWFEELDSTNNELLRHIRDYDNFRRQAADSGATAGFPSPATTSLFHSCSGRKDSRSGRSWP